MASFSMILVIISYETNNRYEIKSSHGQRMYFATEDTALCTRFAMDLIDPLP